jgi:ABC-type uncharacterized transport system auxiliary subunit
VTFVKTRGVLLALSVVLLLVSCTVLNSKPPYAVHLYTMEYLPPVVEREATKSTLRIGRFSVAQSYNSTAMFRRPEAYRLETYNYHRWRANPGDMVTDFLLRDFRNSTVFKAAFSYRESAETEFMIEGSVGEFLATRDADGWKALLSLEITLLDSRKTSIAEKVLFQKRYTVTEPMREETPEELARAMSGAMSRASAATISDVGGMVASGGSGRTFESRER